MDPLIFSSKLYRIGSVVGSHSIFVFLIATVPIVYLSDSFFEFLIKIFITYIIFFF